MQARGGDGRPLPDDDNFDDELDEASPSPIPAEATKALRRFIERIETLDTERRSISEEINEIKKEAKGAGFLIPVINFILRERRKDREDVEEFNATADLYRSALEE